MKKTLFLCSCLSLASLVVPAKTFVRNITSDRASTLTVFLPEGNATGRAIVVCPGGGYSKLMVDYEGTDWAGYFMDKGIACCVLKYRMPSSA